MKSVLLFAASLTLAGCVAMHMPTQQEIQAQTCHYDGAYQAGVNDAQGGEEMQGERLAQQCPPETQAATRKGYRDGYMTSKATRASNRVTNINIGNGYAAPPPPKQCIEKYGKTECGYGCTEAYGTLRCAHEPGNNCMEAYGKIKCGSNCRKEYGDVKCDDYE